MKIIYTGRKVNLKDTFIEKVETKMEKLDKFFNDEADATVKVDVEKSYQKVEITVRDGGFMARAERSAERMEDAFDAAYDVLTQNIIKNRKKLETRLYRKGEENKKQEREFQAAAAMGSMFEDESEFDEDIVPVKEKRFVVKPCLVDEAILQMDMLGHSFFLFRDADTDEINVVYKRKDGAYGLLIPER